MSPRTKRFCRRAFVSALSVFVIVGLLNLTPLAPTDDAEARVASGGQGLYREQIEWFEFGTAGEAIPNEGITRTNVVELGGERLEITCSLKNIERFSGPAVNGPLLEAYRPGSWQNDGLDKIYNIGGTGRNNQLITGISNRRDGNGVSFDFECSVVSGGEQLPVPGLVMADAESSSLNEYVEATPRGDNVTWRVIDRYRTPGCSNSTVANRNANNTLRLSNRGGECANGGPTAVAFMEGATSARASFQGRGKSAIALGVMVGFDRADAPASYGDAPHFATSGFEGGTIPQGQNVEVHGGFQMARALPPIASLGERVSAEARPKFSANADADNFDDAFSGTEANLTIGRSYALPPGTCRGEGFVRGWIDFNVNGKFDDGEASNPIRCANGEFNLTFDNVPPGTKPAERSFLRLRYGLDENAVSKATGFGGFGEVEDYAIRLNLARLNVIKELPNRADASDQFRVAITRGSDTIASAETTGSQTRVQTGAQVVDDGTYTLTDTKTTGSTGFADYAATIRCVDTVNNSEVSTTGSAPSWNIQGITPKQNVECTITNRPQTASITLDKTAGEPSGNTAGSTVPYSFLVKNTGQLELRDIIITDAKISGISCPTTTLAPGAETTCTGTYTLTQADVNAGKVDNTATVNGTTPGGKNVNATDTATVNVAQNPAITIDKTSTVSPAERANGVLAGDRITYSFLVRNTGNVTLTDVGVDDAAAGAVTCPTTTLEPGQETTCTADSSRTVTQADVDRGGTVDNTATSRGNGPGGNTVRSDPDTERVPVASPAPALELHKSASRDGLDADAPLAVGQQIKYSFTVRNTGNVTLTDVGVDDPTAGAVTCEQTTLAPEARTSCTADNAYTVTQDDVNRGRVDNTARAKGKDPSGNDVPSNDSSTSVPGQLSPGIDLRKSAGTPNDVNGNGLTDAGDTIQFTFEVENTGNVTLDNISVSDPKVGSVTCDPTTLQPQQTARCSADAVYTITQADVDAGAVENTASATGTPPGGGDPVRDDSSTRTPTDTTARIALTKSAGTPTDVNGNGRTDAGDTIQFTFVVKNTGSVTVTDVAVSDPKVGSVTCDPTTLAPGAEANCTADAVYTITQADADAGSVENTARATSNGPNGPTNTPDASTSTPVSQEATLALEKSAGDPVDVNENGRIDAGDTVAYTFVVTNTGAVTIREVSIADDKVPNVSCTPLNLAPGEQATCSSPTPYTLTQADVDAGEAKNTATAGGNDPKNNRVTSPPADTTTPIPAAPSITLEKTAGTPEDANESDRIDAGDTIEFTFRVTNTGNTTLNDVTVNDPKVGAVTCDPSTLAPGDEVTCTANELYTITQADVDSGSVKNTATSTGTPPNGDPVTSDPSETETPIEPFARIDLLKLAEPATDVNGNGLVDVGDTIQFVFTVSNNGNLTLNDVTVNDPLAGPVTCEKTSLAGGESTECRADAVYTITQEDVDRGAVTNTATTSGTPPNGERVESPPDTSTTVVDGESAIALEKRAAAPVDANGNGRIDAGDTIQFSFTVTNTGGLTLTSVAVSDALAGPVTCEATTLAPGASTECTADSPYVITAADADAGAVRNTAGASGKDPQGDDVTSDPAETVTPVEPSPSLSLVKRAGVPVDVNDNGRTDAGDTIQYSFTVSNTGNVTLREIAVNDDKAGAVSCEVTELAPGASTECAADAVYVITQADVDAGSVKNTANSTGTPPSGPPVTSDDSDTDTPIDPVASLSLVKRATAPEDVNGNLRPDAGDVIRFTFTVTNTGNTVLSDIAVLDELAGPVRCAQTTLEPGASTECAADNPYVITQEDADAGRVVNVATSTGTPPNGPPVTSNESETDTPVEPAAELEIVKIASPPRDTNGNGMIDPGDAIEYTFRVTNTGTVTIRQLQVHDDKVGNVSCEATELPPGETTNCRADELYILTHDDLDFGRVINAASVTGVPPFGPPIRSEDSETDTPLDPLPRLELEKLASAPIDVNGNGVIDVGDQIEYTFLVTNTGNVTLTDIRVVDDMVESVACEPTTLLSGEAALCVASLYTITQADIEAGGVRNIALATGTPPQGPPIESPPDEVETPMDPRPGIAVEKRAGVPTDVNRNGITDVGDTIQFTFTVTNTGNTVLRDIAVNDPKAGSVTCESGALDPGESTECAADEPYVVTQADVRAGAVVNVATSEGTPPGTDTPVTSDPSETRTPVKPTPTPPPTPLPPTGGTVDLMLPALGLLLLAAAALVVARRRHA